MKCICNLKGGQEITIDKGEYTVLMMKKRYGGFYIEAWGDGVARMRINYCPKCGRKLNGD